MGQGDPSASPQDKFVRLRGTMRFVICNIFHSNLRSRSAETRTMSEARSAESNGGALRVNSEPSPFFTQDITAILETYIKLDYSMHTLVELLVKPRDMKRFVIL